MTFTNEEHIKKDRLRYTKNKLSANLTYLSIVFDCIYFILLYSLDITRSSAVRTQYYVWMMGISVLYNLIFLLISFLCSQGVMNYSKSHGYVLMIVGACQVIRIFIWPTQLHSMTGLDGTLVMTDDRFVWEIICLVASAAISIIAGIVAVIKTTTLRNYEAELKRRGS